MKNYLYRLQWLSKYIGYGSAVHYLLQELQEHPLPMQVTIPGFPSLWIRPKTTDIMMAIDVLGHHEYHFPINKTPQLIVDAGANIGVASIFFRSQFSSATILAIEPDPSNFEILKQNVADDSLCIPIQSAVWNRDASLVLDHSQDAECAVMTVEQSSKTLMKQEVSTITIPEIIETHGVIDILKLDIEGAEYYLFDPQAQEWLTHVNVIMIELHDRYVSGCSRRFFQAIQAFPQESVRGENFCVSRPGWLAI